MIKKLKNYDWKRIDFITLIIVFILSNFGAFTLKLAGQNKVIDGVNQGMSYMKSQYMGIALGFFIIIILTFVDYHFICQFALFYYVFGIILTLLTRSPIGTDLSTEAYRWIKFGPITFQPSELLKIIYILFIAWLVLRLQRKLTQISTIFIIIVLTLIPMFAVLTQPDLSSSLVIFFVMIVVMFTANIPYKNMGIVFGIPTPFLVAIFWYCTRSYSFTYKKLWHVYQYRRIIGWLNPTDAQFTDINYQQLHSVSAIASGGLYGKYLTDSGEDATRLYNSVGVNESDFIWSVIGEEFGFLGSLLVIILFALLVIRCFRIAHNASDFQGKIIAMGIGAMFMFQVFTNISVSSFIFPNTGLPLPFISQGLSSMISSMIAIGLLINISIQPAKSSKGGLKLKAQNVGMDYDY
ncbi:MAG: FtsW/RodA/SpoVE family cell cycle protein [Lachnospiraceae bacterium]|nr:FtsW/RodA/SpoVE family cell cycle protein [Lachnospiraceae bacterium]